MSIDAEPQVSPSATDGPPSDDEPSPWRGRLIGVGVAAAALLFVALTRPEVITGSFGTVGSTVRVLGLIVGFVVLSLLVNRFVANKIVGKAIVWGLAALLIVVAVVPSYFDEEVDQDLATSAADLGLDDVTSTDDDADVAASGDAEAAGDQGDDAAAPEGAAPEPPAPDEPPVDEQADDAPLPQPVKLTTGQFSGLAGHRGSGEAAIYQLVDGTEFVRLEDFDVSNGPGIELWVVPANGAESPDGGTKLADLPGNNGNFNAAIPAGFDTSGDVTILLWCAPVGTPMAGATQSPA